MRRRRFFALCLFSLPFLGGCMFPYCVPALDCTPRVKLHSEGDTVIAYRVDTTTSAADMDFYLGGGHKHERLTPIPASNADEVPAQVKPSMTYGLVVLGIALNYTTCTSHSVSVRLYRPGYELVEINSWEWMNRVVWKPAPDLASQEKALDALLPYRQLGSGSTSPAHREALLYGASEYERLATLTQSAEQRDRLVKKASWFRELADTDKPVSYEKWPEKPEERPPLGVSGR